MVEYNSLQYLPTEEDLPETDNTPVDDELQILIPNLLRAILVLLWASRMDWFLGVNLGIYDNPDFFNRQNHRCIVAPGSH
jgi:Uma2 family endonuclease